MTAKRDAMRTGWYPNQAGLNPAIVGGSTFGRIFKTALTLAPSEVVLAQPLVFGNTLFIATEGNNLYALDAATGAITASRALGVSWNGSDVDCQDLPAVGITGTPVIDPATGTAYFFSKTYEASASAAAWYAHAVDAVTLEERPNFPIEIAGTASNDPTITFTPMYQMQRPGLLLMNGVVYAGFGPHCDDGNYHGYVVGVGAEGGITTIFATEAGPDGVRGAGIWQSGGGLASDGPGQILLSTSNGYSNSMSAPIPGATPPMTLDQSVVRLQVQPDGSLRPSDFFTPYDVAELDAADLDLGSSGPMGLPDCYGTAAHPHLVLAGGKASDMFLLDRDDLGGFKQGPNQGDAYVSLVSANEGLWSTPALWPGDGRWIYVMPKYSHLQAFQYAPRGDGVPAMAAVGASTDTFGYFSGSPIVTSNGTTSGSALVWVTYTASAWGDGSVRAYNAVPDSAGTLDVVYEDAYGKSSKFQVPGVGDGRIYVATSDGNVVGYGSPISAAVSAAALDFGTIVINSSTTKSLVVTATQATQVTGITSANAGFTLGTATPALPAALAAGQTITVPVAFSPTQAQEYVGDLVVATSGGPVAVSAKGIGQVNVPKLRVTPGSIRFGGIAMETSRIQNVAVTNVGATTLTFATVVAPSAPFTLVGGPAPGDTLASGASLSLSVEFSPLVTGTYSDSVQLTGDSNSVTILLTGTSATPSVLAIAPLTLDYGIVAPGTSTSLSFEISDPGGVDLTITKSKPPNLGTFVATTSLPEGDDVAAGGNVTERVSFEPMTEGAFTDQWVIGSSAASGTQTVTLTGRAGLGTGLSATYFDGSSLSSATTVQQIDPTINFTWATNVPPTPGISVPTYSARWTGQVEALYTETYTFTTTSDDGIRLWLNGVELVNDWVAHAKTVDTGTIALVAGQRYDIVVEYFNATGSGIAELQWSSPSQALEVIPAAFLFPTATE